MTDLGDYLREELARLEARCCEIREMLSDLQWQAYNLAHGVTATPDPPAKMRRHFVQPSNTVLNGTASTILRTTVIDPETRRATASSASAPRTHVEGQR